MFFTRVYKFSSKEFWILFHKPRAESPDYKNPVATPRVITTLAISNALKGQVKFHFYC